jgi:UDP-sugar transporter A1/2/3
MPPAGGKRYLTSTAVFLNEMVKLAISLTMALYDVSKAAPPSMPATSLFFSLTSAVFSGDSWKLAIPASLGVLSSSLQYIALSNMQAASFQVTSQLQFFTTAIFGLMVLRRSIAPQKWGLLLLLLVGVALVQIPDANSDQMTLQDESASLHFPRSLEEWKAAKGISSNLHKRSATYEGIEEDIQTADPHLNPTLGLLAIIGAALASGLGGIYFEKVLKDSSNHTSLWVRNVQLAIYSVFPALFIGVVFRDGDTISNGGFFQGYNWAVWTTIVVHALGGILSTFSISSSQRDPKSLATTISTVLSILASIYLFDFELTARVRAHVPIIPKKSHTDNVSVSFLLALLLFWSQRTIMGTRVISPQVFGLLRFTLMHTRKIAVLTVDHPCLTPRTNFRLNCPALRSCRMVSRPPALPLRARVTTLVLVLAGT